MFVSKWWKIRINSSWKTTINRISAGGKKSRIFTCFLFQNKNVTLSVPVSRIRNFELRDRLCVTWSDYVCFWFWTSVCEIQVTIELFLHFKMRGISSLRLQRYVVKVFKDSFSVAIELGAVVCGQSYAIMPSYRS